VTPAPDTSASRGAACAFFDMDRTLLSVNSGALFARLLRRRGLITRRRLVRSVVWLLRYRFGLGSLEDVWAQALATIAGWAEPEMRTMCDAWVHEELVPCVYPRAMDLVRAHRAAGHRVALLTGATDYAVGPLCAALGIDEYVCSHLEVVGGRFTGRPEGLLCYGRGKLARARAWAGAAGVDLAASWFYTDSASDLPTLEAVGHPRPTNPDARLRFASWRRGWPVLWMGHGGPAPRIDVNVGTAT
jgi:HAD superfamily hydrolase (TIGR01490 family)